jgi:iron(III) transport system substrate-binding protein
VPSIATNNPALDAMGKFKADPLPIGSIAKNVAAAQRIYDRAGWK